MKTFLTVLLFLSSGAANACGQGAFPNGRAFAYTNPVFAQKSTVLCFEQFAVYWSGLTRSPLYSAQYLTPEELTLSKTISRQGDFYEEPRLRDGAKLTDYRYSGWDRGHLTPSADMPTLFSQQESFSLANIVPQNRTQNSQQWLSVEKATRAMASRQPLYVITGVVFEGQNIQFLKGRVGVPTSIYKVIYNKQTNSGAVYWSENTPEARVSFMDLSAFEKRTGLSLGLKNPGRLNLLSLR